MANSPENKASGKPIKIVPPEAFPVEWADSEESELLWSWDNFHNPAPPSPMQTSTGLLTRKGIQEKQVDEADVRGGVWRGAFDAGKIGEDEEVLIRMLRRFERVIEIAARDRDPAAVAEYLRELSAAYQHYYQFGNTDASKRVLCEDEPLRRARLAVSAATQIVLRNGFRILGLTAPDRM